MLGLPRLVNSRSASGPPDGFSVVTLTARSGTKMGQSAAYKVTTVKARARQRAVRTFRRSGALPLIERLRYLSQRVQYAGANRRFVAEHPDERMPPAWVMYDAFSRLDYDNYWVAGQLHADYYAEVASSFLPGQPATVCDWGCGPGRATRHLAVRRDLFSKVIGLDYNETSITWCQANLPGAEFRRNDLAPPMPLDEASVDYLIGFSVLTHLSEALLLRWVEDVKRVVRPGGVILLTTHGDASRSKLLPDELATYDARGVVERGSVKEGSRIYATFTSPDYIRGITAPMEVLRFDDRTFGGQDTWVFRRS